jgi:hypothetical protein
MIEVKKRKTNRSFVLPLNNNTAKRIKAIPKKPNDKSGTNLWLN